MEIFHCHIGNVFFLVFQTIGVENRVGDPELFQRVENTVLHISFRVPCFRENLGGCQVQLDVGVEGIVRQPTAIAPTTFVRGFVAIAFLFGTQDFDFIVAMFLYIHTYAHTHI